VNNQKNPCLEHDCHECCVATTMTLTEEDVTRLTALGYRKFYRVNQAGDLQLVNAGGRCVFLEEGLCSAHDHRPEGCELYPLILDLDEDRVIRHDFCPHADEFQFGPEDEQRLRDSVAAEKREAEERREHVSSANSHSSEAGTKEGE
jgi:Fe-S-cluster containining protein